MSKNKTRAIEDINISIALDVFGVIPLICYLNLMTLRFWRALFIMGRDPVELAKRAKYKPPAMRVRGVCYTKKSPFRYNEVVQAKT